MLRVGYAIALVMLVAGCAPAMRTTAPAPTLATRSAPDGFPGRRYEEAAARGKSIYRVDPERSLVSILVRRGGSLAHLGHDHVVASRGVQGYVARDEGTADLFVPLADLSVDEPALRAESRLDTQPTESDIAGTRSNMLDKVLETQRFPFALIHISSREKTPTGSRLGVAITLHGVSRSFDVPVHMETSPDEMSVAGTLELKQSDFGIVPFSILGGAMQVQDRLSLRFTIRARPVDARP
ncbi:YceI family protein [Variovorax sp. J2P1-59]|uniref:YceI family protein n=1 Tax=Variovorax flavidus TaxID=3053501 RepID=UPI002574AE38|nr:YceI family protein [Variovorax sp. J2P1-59]MDM0074059.1 YceI family protein [Variovorax sp. J2P1-59]